MKMKTRDVALSGIFLGLLIVCSLISIPIGPVPITLSLFAVFLIGALLSPLNAVSVCALYIAIGLIGLPVFSGFGAGISKIIGPTGGYIISYPFMAAAISLFVKYGKASIFYPIGMSAALIICYALGASYMMISLNITLKGALFCGVVPFIISDGAKIALASFLACRLNQVRERQRTKGLA